MATPRSDKMIPPSSGMTKEIEKMTLEASKRAGIPEEFTRMYLQLSSIGENVLANVQENASIDDDFVSSEEMEKIDQMTREASRRAGIPEEFTRIFLSCSKRVEPRKKKR